MSPLGNMDFRVEVQETLRRKLRRHAPREVELIMYPSTSSASPALSQYSGNSLVDCTSASEGDEGNATVKDFTLWLRKRCTKASGLQVCRQTIAGQ